MELASALLLLLSFIVFSAYIYGLRPFQRWKIRAFPGPKERWLVGNALDLINEVQHENMRAWAGRFGPDPIGAVLCADTVVIVSEPEAAREVLLHGRSRPDFSTTRVLRNEVWGPGETNLLTARGDKWRGLRAIWQPLFFTGSLENYVGLMDSCAKLLAAEVLQVAEQKQEMDIMSSIQDMALNVVGQTAFGVDLHSQKAGTPKLSPEEREKSRKLREGTQKAFTSIAGSPWLVFARVFPFLRPLIRVVANLFPDKTMKVLVDSRTAVFETAESLIREHRAQLRDEVSGTVAPGTGGLPAKRGVQPGSFLDLLVKGNDRSTGEALSDAIIAQQAASILMAGFETTASLLAFTVYLLSKPCNAAKQAKMLAEIEALGKDWTPTFEELESKLPYLTAVLKESMRLFPPAHTLVREAEQDMHIAGYAVKKGQWLIVPAFTIHNEERHWGADAGKFVPERFLDTSTEAVQRVKTRFLPFGLGARACPGYRFALAEAKVALVRLYQSCTLELCSQEPLQCRATITLSPKNGVWVRPKLRL